MFYRAPGVCAPWRVEEGKEEARLETHLYQNSKEEANAELLHALGSHAAVIAVVSLLLQGVRLHSWLLTVAWGEGDQGCYCGD